MIDQLRGDLQKLADSEKAKFLAGFFKTGKGQYAEGDIFLGITVPAQRAIAKKYEGSKLSEIKRLLKSKIHEERLVGLLILVEQFKKAGEKGKVKIFNFYLNNIGGVNNWDLVDLSAPNIAGEFIFENKAAKNLVYKLRQSDNLWERRISVLAAFAFIKRSNFEYPMAVVTSLITDKHDLIHKAVGWMLREVGKKDEKVLGDFLIKYHRVMPRTMLRYAIERMDEEKRRDYLKGLKT